MQSSKVLPHISGKATYQNFSLLLIRDQAARAPKRGSLALPTV
jgi:hypothetical protein